MADALLPPPVWPESADSGENTSPSSVVRDEFQPPVKMEFGETEFISQGVGTVSASDDCSESDPLEWTPSDVKCHENELKRSPSFFAQEDADVKFQPWVKLERIKTEFISPTVGSLSASEECSESDPLELTPYEATCQGEHVPGSPSSPDFMGFSTADLNKTRDAVHSKVEALSSDMAEMQTTQAAAPSSQERRGRRRAVVCYREEEDLDGDITGDATASYPDATVRCLHCDFECLGQHRLDKHVKNRHGHVGRSGRHKCERCPYSTDNAGHLLHHRMTHTGERPHRCDICGKAFAQRSYMAYHHRVHTGQKPFECDVCGKAFGRSSHLTSHYRVHTGERPYECNVCGKTFGDGSVLTRHHRVHTGQRPYECDVCGKALAQRSDLTAHRRTHTGQRPYECDVCGKTFGRRSYLTSHHSVHTR